jgi:hypothetical protein
MLRVTKSAEFKTNQRSIVNPPAIL